MTKGFLTIAAVLALVLLFAAAAVPEEITIPETEPITAPEPTVPAQIPTARYRLTADERELICEVVMAESGIEPFDGKMAVSQCMHFKCLRKDRQTPRGNSRGVWLHRPPGRTERRDEGSRRRSLRCRRDGDRSRNTLFLCARAGIQRVARIADIHMHDRRSQIFRLTYIERKKRK